MTPKIPDELYTHRIVVDDLPGLKNIELEWGPLIPAYLAWRLAGRCKKRVYQLMQAGKIKRFSVLGVTMVPQRQVEMWIEGRL